MWSEGSVVALRIALIQKQEVSVVSVPYTRWEDVTHVAEIVGRHNVEFLEGGKLPPFQL